MEFMMNPNEIINYDKQLPAGLIFNLFEMDQLAILNKPMAKKLIHNGKLEHILIGNKIHLSRFELVRYFSSNTKNCSTERTITSYDDQFPQRFKFNLRELSDLRILKTAMTKKLISTEAIVCILVGNKLHISRAELIKYFEKNTHRKAIR